MSTAPACDRKAAVRRDMLQRLRGIDPARREEKSALLRGMLAPFLGETEGLLVGLYAPLPHEADLVPLLREYPRHRYAFPRCLPGRQMEFRLVSDPGTELIPGAYGIRAPREELPLAAPGDMDLLLTPGVAFTRSGERLGYGGGYYDRYMPRCAKAKLIALAFCEQILASLPTEAHDLRIPYLFTA